MGDLIALFKALSDPSRLRILRLLIEGELCVCELEHILSMSQSRISHQLSTLKEASIVKDRRMGKWVLYSLEDNSYLRILIPALRNWLEGEEFIREDLKRARKCLGSDVKDRCKRLQWGKEENKP